MLEKSNLEELRELAEQLESLEEKDKDTDKPQNDDELHAWILNNLGINIPRVAACPDHDAPFDVIADLFFNRVNSALLMANRGGGKSYLAALWNFLNCFWIPEVECLSMGAIEIQSKRVFQHIKMFQNKAAAELVGDTTISQTIYKNDSKYEIITGSLASVNGPHSQKVHRDEVELIKSKQIYQESLQIEKSKVDSQGNVIPAQTLLTSTRKSSDGLMQEILDECKEAEQAGMEPPFKVYVFCIKDIVQEQNNCRIAYPDLPEGTKCDCHRVKSGEWEEGKPRTLDQICGGIFAKARGFTPIEDVKKTFVTSGQAIWDAQQECKRPYVEDISIPEFSEQRNGVRNYAPDPANGPIYIGVDFGGTNPHAVEFLQILEFEVEVDGYADLKRLPEGSHVLFDEIYIAEIGNSKLADLITDKILGWRQIFPSFRHQAIFADPQAKAARLDFKEHTPSLPCTWPIVTRDREEHKKHLQDLVVDNLFFVDLERCKMFTEEISVWNIDIKKFDHAVDSGLYVCHNAKAAEKRRSFRTETHVPSAVKRVFPGQPSIFNDNIPSAISSDRFGLPKSEDWRKKYSGV